MNKSWTSKSASGAWCELDPEWLGGEGEAVAGRGPDVRPRLQLHAEQLQQPRQGELRQRAAQLLADTPPPTHLEGVELRVGAECAGVRVQESLRSEGEGVRAPGGGGGVGGPLQRQHHRARGQHPVPHLSRGA